MVGYLMQVFGHVGFFDCRRRKRRAPGRDLAGIGKMPWASADMTGRERVILAALTRSPLFDGVDLQASADLPQLSMTGSGIEKGYDL